MLTIYCVLEWDNRTIIWEIYTPCQHTRVNALFLYEIKRVEELADVGVRGNAKNSGQLSRSPNWDMGASPYTALAWDPEHVLRLRMFLDLIRYLRHY